MNRILFSLIGLMLTFAPLFAHANTGIATVDCYVAAMADPAVLAASKAYGPMAPEDAAVKLCAGTTNAEAPLACYKTVMTTPSILAATKAFGALAAENSAVKLCAPAPR